VSDLRVVLVDDEALSLSLLRSLVDDESGFNVVAECRNGREAIAALQSDQFDIMLLDIQMPGVTGLEVVEMTQADRLPAVIFATAYDEHACRAFDLHAVDYVLKPFDPKRIRLALERARARLAAEGWVSGKSSPINAIAELSEERLSDVIERPSASEFGRLPIKDGGHTYLLSHDEIEWIDAAGDYMCVHAGGKVYILRSTMKALESKLSSDFVRIHRSTIVNLRRVRAVDTLPKGECLLHLDKEVTVRVSRNYRTAIQHLLS
jgi:two-component system, LytTR family, response regulator